MADLELILKELRGFRQENKEQLEAIKEEILKANTRLDEAEGRIEKAEERIQNTEEVITEMLKLHVKLEDKLMDLESRSRRENVRIYGVPEGSEKESPIIGSFVEKLLREGLGLPEDEPDLQIERAHRSLGPRPPEDAPPRSIIVKFLSFKTKETLLRKAWQKVRKVLKENQVQFQTLFPARLRVRYKDGTKIYETIEEATKDLTDRGYTVKIIRPPDSLMEQVRRLTWRRAGGRRARESAFKAGSATSYKEKLRAFRRPSPTPSAK
ncbi:hypothetical protein SKAU_G00277150 [Synaphobranchus kaupii]|uniref:L1 transposable element RRM domain-containing protein n=1 Tax=Synaphobranchus kaupii TaxID=118154 RepID=A0A9Q1IR69_SYNKA|nr:hypothetical protein SKAU_G00275870 [Synaphobranchus kaupii]KAJ8349126.1 hypothetical protein SKAU_G00277150 [Synaphobranchus kaupii]